MFLCLTSLSSFAYNGPKKPVIPAENSPIRLKFEECLADVNEVIDWGDQGNREEAKNLCDLRTQHLQARNRVLDDLAKLVETFDGATNHDHDQNLPLTIKSVQTTVAACLKTLVSQQYPHNIAIVSEPEENAIFCDTIGAQVVEAITTQY